MKKMFFLNLCCITALLSSACSDSKSKDNTKNITEQSANTKTFKVSLEDVEHIYHDPDRVNKILYITAKDDIEITKIMANRGACDIHDGNIEFENFADDSLISGDIPAKICSENMRKLSKILHLSCSNLEEWYNTSGNCNYRLNINDEIVDFTPQEISECNRLKAKGINYYDYKLPMKFGQKAIFEIDKCPVILELTIFTNKGKVTYNFN